MPEKRDQIKEAYDALDNDKAQMEFLFKRMASARTNLGNNVERESLDCETSVFLENLTDDIKQEWIETKDYQALKRKILGYDADIPWWDEKHLLNLKKTELVELGELFARVAEESEREDLLPFMSDEEKEAFYKNKFKNDLIASNRERDEEGIETLLTLLLKVGLIDSAQFIEWLYSTDDGDNFINGPFETLEDFFVWKLVTEHGGNYTIPEGTTLISRIKSFFKT